MNAMNAAAFAGTVSSPPERISCVAERTCLPSLLALTDSYCTRHKVDPQSQHDLRLIVEEACVNVMSHAYPPGEPGPLSLQIEARLHDGLPAMEITIEDQGRPFNPLELPAPDQTGPLDELPIGGLGVLLIRRLSDLQHYSHDRQRGNVFMITKFLPPARRD
ncbi:MAG: ATP-binding protein [Burkholderiaceae bacterium]